MQIVVILYCLENNGKKIIYMCSLVMYFFLNISNPQLVLDMDAESTCMEDQLDILHLKKGTHV